MARHSLNRIRHNGIVTKQAGAGAAGWRWPTRPRSPSSPTPPPPPPPGWTRPAASSPWRGSWERRGKIRCPMEGLPSRRRGGEPARLSTVVENLSILDTRRCARLRHRSSCVDLDGDEDECGGCRTRHGTACWPSCRGSSTCSRRGNGNHSTLTRYEASSGRGKRREIGYWTPVSWRLWRPLSTNLKRSIRRVWRRFVSRPLTGLRISEVCSIHWEHVDFESGRVTLPETKTGRRA